MATRPAERAVVRGRRQTPSEARLPVNETGLEAQPTRFSAGLWAVILFLSSEAMFFSALFTAYFYLRARLPAWEPVFQRCIDFCEKPGAEGLVLVNTIVLVSSSFTMQLAVWSIQGRHALWSKLWPGSDRAWAVRWLALTVAMGTFFITGQGYEYTRLGFLPDNGIFAAVFFTLTGFHGAHVTGGILLNSYILYRLTRGHFSRHRHVAFEGASLYWHFVDVVWIGLFTTIYIVG